VWRRLRDELVKVRVGVGLGINQLLSTPAELGRVVGLTEDLGFDSLWFSERVCGPALDPLAALAYAVGCSQRLKVGTNVLVLPGRNPVLLAKELATIDQLSQGRLLLALGLGTADPDEHAAFGVSRASRGGRFEESLALMRRLWEGDACVNGGDGEKRLLSVHPRPFGSLEVWLGGRAPRELQRAGRLGDGWLSSFLTPSETGTAREQVVRAAAAVGRSIDPEHFGTVVLYARGSRPRRALDLLATHRPDAPQQKLLPCGARELESVLRGYVQEGISKFVAIPAGPPDDWNVELSWLRARARTVET
jgi:probable F420-dependent oxidoreductase